MSKRTIILLSAKRCGSTAIFKMFQKHPEVGVCHIDNSIDNWEPNFWNYAADAIEGNPEKFIERFQKSHPFLELPDKFTEDAVFKLWDNIISVQGPVIFDKSPQYLNDDRVFVLLKEYMRRGNDVRFFSMIRDPRDAITSQFELWHDLVDKDSPERRENVWLQQYQRLEKLQSNLAYIPLFRYEDLTSAPSCYLPMVFKHCGISHLPESYNHLKPTSVGRYLKSAQSSIKEWKFSDAFKFHLRKYGYSA